MNKTSRYHPPLFWRYFILEKLLLVIFFSGFMFSCNSYKSEFVEIDTIATHRNGMEFVSMQECIACHKDIVESHMKTSHYKTSFKTDATAFDEMLKTLSNEINLDDGTKIVIKKEGNTLFQDFYVVGNQTPVYHTPMDITIGSGFRGQSFLYWNEEGLFQNQASVFGTMEGWINSPGYASQINNTREVVPRCMECHSSYAAPLESSSNRISNKYDIENVVLGIDCQRCHGEVKEHVLFHKKNPDIKDGQHILKYSELTQQQRIDACALCHSGFRQPAWDPLERKFIPSFSYQVGDELNDYLVNNNSRARNNQEPEIHANQTKLLMDSKCFIMSENMDCATCHDPHAQERGDFQNFSLKCISCHQSQNHTEKTLRLTNANFEDCTSCHMPFVDSQAMKIDLNLNELTPVKIRNHLISIYPQDINLP
jgi:hypothetical protein